jgi:hypothetical protein
MINETCSQNSSALSVFACNLRGKQTWRRLIGVLGNNESSRERSAVSVMFFFDAQVDDCESFEAAMVE